jgi:hypothetical protein
MPRATLRPTSRFTGVAAWSCVKAERPIPNLRRCPQRFVDWSPVYRTEGWLREKLGYPLKLANHCRRYGTRQGTLRPDLIEFGYLSRKRQRPLCYPGWYAGYGHYAITLLLAAHLGFVAFTTNRLASQS